MNLRCGCITHRESDDLVGCPVIQVERLTSLIKNLEKQLEIAHLAMYEAGTMLVDTLPDGYFDDDAPGIEE